MPLSACFPGGGGPQDAMSHVAAGTQLPPARVESVHHSKASKVAPDGQQDPGPWDAVDMRMYVTKGSECGLFPGGSPLPRVAFLISLVTRIMMLPLEAEPATGGVRHAQQCLALAIPCLCQPGM